MKKSVIIVVLLLISVSLVSAKIVDIPSVSDQGELTDGEDIPPEPLVEQNLGVTRYTYAGNTLVASQHNGNVKYYHQDRLGSNRIVTDSSGVVDSEYLSLPFGQSVVDDVKYGFTGKELDSSGLHYFGARYYDSNLGRFSSVDPLNGVDGNLAYAYVGNNPMNFVDPTGMDREYTVQKGDVLSNIAKTNNVDMTYLLFVNPSIKDPNSISIGQKITIPEYDLSKIQGTPFGEAISRLGIKEDTGKDPVTGKTKSNPVIDKMHADVTGHSKYSDDDPWCGAFAGTCLKEAGFPIPSVAVRAKEYLNYGTKVDPKDVELDDLLIFSRGGSSGHVGFYAGETKTHYLVLGGNQGNEVKHSLIPKDGHIIDIDTKKKVQYKILDIRRP